MTAATDLAAWIEKNPNPNKGNIRANRKQNTLTIYWKGAPPAALQALADKQSVTVKIVPAAYSLADLAPIAKQLVTDHGDVVSSAGPSKDYSGVGVTLWSKTKETKAAVMETLNADSRVPVQFERYADLVSLSGS